jgi:hypothetical protein
MEFLLLAVLGLATLGAKEVLAPEEKEDKDKKDDKGDKGDKANAKDSKGDGDKPEEPQKTPEQELMEAIAKYESQAHTGKKIKFLYEIEDK